MTPQELKNSILQLAIQGKLVEQRSEEGAAEELYEQIQAEKKKLIKAGTIKIEGDLPDISEDEIPFDIPDSWKWVRLGDCSSYSQRKEKVNASAITDNMWSLDLEDIEKDTGRIINKCRAAERKIAGDKVQFRKGQILYSKLRPYLKKVLVAPDDGICSSEMVPFVAYGNIDAQYIVYVLVTPHVDYIINSVTYGVKMPRVGTETMVNLLIPLPPLAEQKRIVARIEELLPYIDRYEQAWSKLEDFNKRFPGDMQKSILQMAIQGKLVEQLPEEGTGEELYQQIHAEKQRLIKAGTIKKGKPLPEITEDEKPFDIPESWKWVRVIDIAFLNSGNQYDECSDGALYIKVADMNLPENQYEICTSTRRANVKATDVIPVGSIIFPKRGGAIATNKKRLVLREPICVDSNTMAMTIITGTILLYLSKWFYSIDLGKLATGTSVPQINNKDIYPLLIPLPPLAEQKRIVAKLEEILPLCEKLK